MSIMVDGIGLPRNGCIGCYFRTAKYCGLKESNDYVWSYAEKGTRPDDCPITEVIRCKDCRYFELNHFDNINGIPMITAHEICTKWCGGCKTSQDGYCFMAERKEE